MRPSERLARIPPYLFAELERKVAAKRAAGVDVISLGIGDPDMPTFAPIVEPRRSARRRTRAPTSTRATAAAPEFRRAVADFYGRRFGVTLDPDSEVMAAIGAKECIFNLNLAFLDPGDVALAADPGYPVYTGGPILAGSEPAIMPLVPERGFAPDLGAISAETARRARLLFVNYPNNPTGAVVPDGFFEELVAFAREHDVLIVHDAAYTRDDLRRIRRAVVPRHPGRQGGRRRGLLAVQGLQHDRLALRGDRRQRRRRSSPTGG